LNKKVLLGAIVFIGIFCAFFYGQLGKTHIIESELIMELPKDKRFIEYHYQLGSFEAIIEFDESSYNYFQQKFFEGASYLECEAKIDSIPYLQALPIIESKGYYANIGGQDVSAILCKSEEATILYVCRPRNTSLEIH